MTDRKHHHDHHHDDQHRPKRQPHKDWRLWAVVGLMLLSMVVYLLPMDEAWQPFGGLQQPVPGALEGGE